MFEGGGWEGCEWVRQGKDGMGRGRWCRRGIVVEYSFLAKI